MLVLYKFLNALPQTRDNLAHAIALFWNRQPPTSKLMTHTRYKFFFLLILLPLLAPAQEKNARALWDQWRNGQWNVRKSFKQIALTENARCVVDGRFGKNEVRTEFRVTHQPRKQKMGRKFLSGSFNGEPFTPPPHHDGEEMGPPPPPFENERQEDQWDPRRRTMRMCRPAPHFLVMQIAQWTSEDEAYRDTFNGEAAWRIKVIPQEMPMSPYVQVWLSRQDNRLLGAQMLVQPPRGGPMQLKEPMDVRVDFDRIRGVDLPKHADVRVTYQNRIRKQLTTRL